MAYEGAILWDLDGTLLSTAKAGRLALRDAIRELTGREADYSDLPTSGLTDAQVAAEALRAVGVQPDDELLGQVRAGYERRLPDALLLREGGVLPGIRETLDGLAARGRVVSVLLTGNTSAGARAKLEHYGLADCFPHGGAFCDGPGGRVPIARRALRLVESLVGHTDTERIVLVGDTPKDVECARALELRAIGVATGSHSVEELRAAGAWHVVARVPDAERLEGLVLDGA
jgi:phosphoglycolate phosphatase